MIRRLLASAALALIVVTPASAEPVEITAQAKAARATFLLKAPPPAPAAAICMVDSGVGNTPDTTAVVDRLSLDGPTSDQSPTSHGTQMAMFIGAQSNGFGMVGMWPAARIVSVRANTAGEDAFTAWGFIFGLKQCDKDAAFYGTKVVLLAFSSDDALTAEETDALRGELAAARQHGLNVVAAAGNRAGGQLGMPAGMPGVFSIGAVNSASGTRCAVSATGSSLLAPGCGLDGAAPSDGTATTTAQGTSYAAAIAATALAALRTWRPDLGPDEAERLLRTSGVVSPDGVRLDLSAAFAAAGFASLSDPLPAPSVPVPIEPIGTPTPTATETPRVKRRLPTPRVSLSTRRRAGLSTITIKASNRPAATQMVIRVYTRDRAEQLHRVLVRTSISSTIRIRVRKWDRITAAFVDPKDRSRTSQAFMRDAHR